MKAAIVAMVMAFAMTNGWCEGAAETPQDKQLQLFKKVTGKELQFSDFQTDDGAASVSAASMVGIAPSTVTVAESTRDIATFIKGFDSKSQGVGLSVSPARISHPWPRVDMTSYLNRDVGAILLTGLTLSIAQGRNEVDSRNYVRRAFAVTTGGTFDKKDDPIWVMSSALGNECSDKAIQDQLNEPNPETEQDTGLHGGVIAQPAPAAPAASGAQPDQPAKSAARATQPTANEKVSTLATCIKNELDKLNSKWFRSLWSITYAIGDVRQDSTGSQRVRLGDTLAVAGRWGGGLMKKPGAKKEDEFEWGWSISGSAKFSRNDPVLSTLDTQALERRSTSLVALKGAIGTATARGIAEYSNSRTREAQAGELTLNRAVGLDYRLREGWWLSFRYGKRKTVTGDGEENAGLMALTIGPSSNLKF